jgi:hypothetical protein
VEKSKRRGSKTNEVSVGVEIGGEAAEGGGFSAAGFAGDQAEAAVLEQIVETGAEFALSVGVEELVRGNIFGEREACEAEKLL